MTTKNNPNSYPEFFDQPETIEVAKKIAEHVLQCAVDAHMDGKDDLGPGLPIHMALFLGLFVYKDCPCCPTADEMNVPCVLCEILVKRVAELKGFMTGAKHDHATTN